MKKIYKAYCHKCAAQYTICIEVFDEIDAPKYCSICGQAKPDIIEYNAEEILHDDYIMDTYDIDSILFGSSL